MAYSTKNEYQKNFTYLDKANIYRLHLDNLRWTLNAGYTAFLVVIIPELAQLSVDPTDMLLPISIGLLMISFCYLFILSIQSWYYNLYSTYVKYCEKCFYLELGIVPIAEFINCEGDIVGENGGKAIVKDTITPNHPAFSFAIITITISQVLYLFFLLQL